MDEIADVVMTKEIEEEEKKMEEANCREMERIRKKLEAEEHQKEMKERSYKCLLTILQKSKFYANFLQQNLEDSKKNINVKGHKNYFKEDEVKAIESARAFHEIDQNKNDSLEKRKPKKLELTRQHDDTKLTSFGIRVPRDQPNLLEGVGLRDYQMQGLDWLKKQYVGGMNGILADDMGLGKTVQAIALICHLYEQDVGGPFLIVVPLSTLPNWLIEFERFAPQIPVLMFYGSVNEKKKKKPMLAARQMTSWGRKVCPVVITNYHTSISECKALASIHWKYMIVDEGHVIKNYKTILFRTLSSFPSMNRLLLTGTPLQNNLSELWSLLNFLLPEIFNNLNAFETWFQIEEMDKEGSAELLIKQEKENHILFLLQEILSPFLLRRIKADVDLKLPPKKEVVVYCPLTEAQHSLYKSIVERSLKQIVEKEELVIIPDVSEKAPTTRAMYKQFKDKNANKKQKLRHREEGDSVISDEEKINQIKENSDDLEGNTILVEYMLKMTFPPMVLKKIANHLQLVEWKPQWRADVIDDSPITSSGKTLILDQLLSRLKLRNHKVLIFSTMVQILKILEEVMDLRGYKYEMLTGQHHLQKRKESINNFNTDPSVFAFLISTRAGGLGINLTAADTVIIYDSDWNPHADSQAQDRCHRIGQTKPVVIYRLVTTGTYDERIVLRANSKKKLEQMVLHKSKFKYNTPAKAQSELATLMELRELLYSKEQNLEVYENGSLLSDKEWDVLLDRSDMK